LIQLSVEDRPTLQILYIEAFVIYAFDGLKPTSDSTNRSGAAVNPTMLQLQNNSMESTYFTPITSE
jgi:hypothetical protein